MTRWSFVKWLKKHGEKNKSRMHSRSILPAFINEIYHKCTEDEENEEGDKHVVDGPDVVHLKQLTAEKHKRKWA